MDKTVLFHYIDACELLKETEVELERLQRQGGNILQDSVKGSMHDFPYTKKTYHIEGVKATSSKALQEKEAQLLAQAAVLKKKKAEAEWFLQELAESNPRVARIYRYKFAEGLTWSQVAERLGGDTTGESARKEWSRFEKERI